MPQDPHTPLRPPKAGNLLHHLPHWELLDGTVVLQDGKLCYGLEIQPSSSLFLTGDALEQAHRAYKVILQRGVDTGHTLRVHVEALDLNPDELGAYRDLPESPYPIINDLATARYAMQEDQRAEGHIKKWRYYITCTLNPPTKFKKSAAPTREELRDALKKARLHRDRLFGYLTGADLSPRMMDDQSVFEVMWRYLNPGSVTARPPSFIPLHERPSNPTKRGGKPDHLTLRRQLCHSTLHNEDHIRLTVGNRHLAVLNLASGPQWTVPDMLSELLATITSGSLHVVLEVTHLNPVDTTQKLEDNKQKLYALSEGKVPNTQAKVKLRHVEDAIAHREDTGDHHYNAGMSLLLVARSTRELELMQQEAVSALSRFPGAAIAGHGFQSYFQYLALAPFNGSKTHFPFEVSETTAADLIPASGAWPGFNEPTLLLRNSLRGLTKIDLYSGETNANHFALFAKTGWGKTFAVISLLSALIRRYDSYLTIVDRKEDFKFFIDALGGTVIPFYPGSGTQLNPFDLPSGEVVPDPVKERFLMALLRTFVPRSSSTKEAGEEDALLLEAISQTYQHAALDARMPLLSDLAGTLASMQMYSSGRPLPHFLIDLARSLSIRLQPVIGDRAWGKVLDRPTNRDTSAKHLYYDLSGIADTDHEMRRVAYLLVQDRIWSAVKSLPTSTKKIAFMDEFGSQVYTPEDASFVDLQLRVGRSYNLAFGLATQDLDDMKRVGGLVGAIFYFLLGQMHTGSSVVTEVLQFPESVARAVKTLRKDKGFREFALIYRDGNGLPNGGIVRMEESRLAYWLATSHADDKPKRDQAIQDLGGIAAAARELAGVKT